MTSYWFNDEVRAIGFAAARGSTAHGDASRGWMVVVEDGRQGIDWGEVSPEAPSAFDRIVSRNGGEDAPADIVQRLKVKTIGQYTAFDFHVDLCEVKKPHRMVSFRVTKDDAERFKVGSEIEVVLRPAPLA